LAELEEKIMQRGAVGGAEHREPGQRRAAVAVKRRRNPPDAATSTAQLRLFGFRVFDQAVGRIGHDGVDGARFTPSHPLEGVGVDQRREAEPRVPGRRRSAAHVGRAGIAKPSCRHAS
jgi:hypothetical protein